MIIVQCSIRSNNKQPNIHTWRTLASDSTSFSRRVRRLYLVISCSSSKSSSSICSGNWMMSFDKIVCFDSKYLIHASIVISLGPGHCSSSLQISSSSFKYASRIVWSECCLKLKKYAELAFEWLWNFAKNTNNKTYHIRSAHSRCPFVVVVRCLGWNVTCVHWFVWTSTAHLIAHLE